MKKKKGGKIIFISFLILGLLFWVSYKLKNNQPNKTSQVAQDNSAIILFYGQLCPHCQKVEEFITRNKVKDRLQFSEREVTFHKANSNLMLQKAQQCGLKKDNLGVPFLWDDGQCLMGQDKVIQFFQAKINDNQ